MAEAQREQVLGQYIIDQKIAQGGMAEIFLGRSMEPNGIERPVVIKRILPHIAASEEFITMLIQEAKLAVQLSHGNIAQIFDLGKIGDDYFMVMEYVDGVSLSRIARHLRSHGEFIPIPVALYITSEVANGLDYMHNKTDNTGQELHIVHRDISPQNIIISAAGTVKIIDFGIAKAASQVSTTDSGVVKGKFAYMSPEHVHGERLDARADIFSLGVILWELLTNQRLFKGKNNKETIQRVKRCRIPSPSGYRKDIPKDVERIVKKALSKTVKQRYRSSHDLLLDLVRALVQHYPEFAPKDLQNYVHQLFADSIREEPTHLEGREEIEAVTLVDEIAEPTAFADPAILKERLRELEAYRVAGAADVPLPTEEEAVPAPSQQQTDQSLRDCLAGMARWVRTLPWRRFGRCFPRLLMWGFILLVAGGLAGGAYYAYQGIQSWWRISQEASAPVAPQRPAPTDESGQAAQPAAPTPIEPTPPAVGGLDIHSTPAGAHIYVNDQDTGLITPAQIDDLQAGRTLRIGLYLDPYRYWEQEVQIGPGKTQAIQARLEINYGALQIRSEPTGAQVWVNDEAQGRTPLMLSEIEPGSLHQIRIEAPGFKVWTDSVQVFAGKTTSVQALLLRP